MLQQQTKDVPPEHGKINARARGGGEGRGRVGRPWPVRRWPAALVADDVGVLQLLVQVGPDEQLLALRLVGHRRPAPHFRGSTAGEEIGFLRRALRPPPKSLSWRSDKPRPQPRPPNTKTKKVSQEEGGPSRGNSRFIVRQSSAQQVRSRGTKTGTCATECSLKVTQLPLWRCNPSLGIFFPCR